MLMSMEAVPDLLPIPLEHMIFSLFLNGSHDLSNLAATFAGAANTLVTGNVTGFRVFTTGDFLQLTFDKGSDIPGNPVVQIFGMGFNLYRIT